MRRRVDNESSVSLFPFLSILACIIGTLAFMITALALSAMNTSADDEAIDRAEAYMAQESRNTRLERQIQELRQAAGHHGPDVTDQLTEVEARIETLKQAIAARRAQAERARQDVEELKNQVTEKEDLTGRMESDLERMEQELVALRAEVEARGAPPGDPEIRVMRSGGATIDQFHVFFVEVRADEMVLHDGPQPVRVPRSGFNQNNQFTSLLSRVSQTRSGQLVLLIRQDSAEFAEQLFRVLSERDVLYGRVPVVGQGALDLSAFRR